jgi:hypothetical protein
VCDAAAGNQHHTQLAAPAKLLVLVVLLVLHVTASAGDW